MCGENTNTMAIPIQGTTLHCDITCAEAVFTINVFGNVSLIEVSNKNIKVSVKLLAYTFTMGSKALILDGFIQLNTFASYILKGWPRE